MQIPLRSFSLCLVSCLSLSLCLFPFRCLFFFSFSPFLFLHLTHSLPTSASRFSLSFSSVVGPIWSPLSRRLCLTSLFYHTFPHIPSSSLWSSVARCNSTNQLFLHLASPSFTLYPLPHISSSSWVFLPSTSRHLDFPTSRLLDTSPSTTLALPPRYHDIDAGPRHPSTKSSPRPLLPRPCHRSLSMIFDPPTLIPPPFRPHTTTSMSTSSSAL